VHCFLCFAWYSVSDIVANDTHQILRLHQTVPSVLFWELLSLNCASSDVSTSHPKVFCLWRSIAALMTLEKCLTSSLFASSVRCVHRCKISPLEWIASTSSHILLVPLKNGTEIIAFTSGHKSSYEEYIVLYTDLICFVSVQDACKQPEFYLTQFNYVCDKSVSSINFPSSL